ncbi:MAG TPA: site-specific integrase [Tepidisphaeraceae bacterium]|nr:site-specific integrase [Tepidisphaeraceae bacterium]
MKFADKELVEGTQPPIRIGKRVFKNAAGEQKTTDTYWATFSINGKQSFIPLKVFKRADAIRAAHRLAQKIEVGERDMTERKNVKLGEIVDAYLTLAKGRGRAFKTMEKYTYVLKKLQTWWERQGDKHAARFTVYDFYAFKERLEKDGMSPKTVADRMMIVRQLLKWASEKAKPQKLLPLNPIAGEPLQEEKSKPQPCFTPEQVKLLLDNADPLLKPVFAVMAYTGLRFGEVRDLMWDHVQLRASGGTIRVYGGGTGGRGPKDGEYRTVPVNGELAAILAAVQREQERVFSHPPTPKWPHGTRPLDQTQLLKALKRLCKEVGFPDWKRYKLHTFRHGFASMCARLNLPQKYILDWMGHSESEILDMYITLHDETAQRAINQISYSAAGSEGSAVRNTG